MDFKQVGEGEGSDIEATMRADEFLLLKEDFEEDFQEGCEGSERGLESVRNMRNAKIVGGRVAFIVLADDVDVLRHYWDELYEFVDGLYSGNEES